MNEAEVRAILARADALGILRDILTYFEALWGVTGTDAARLEERSNANKAFVAAARTDVPALAREVLALREERDYQQKGWLETLAREREWFKERKALREALAALCDWHTWPEVDGVFGLAAAHGVTVAPQISEKAQAIWAQAKALLAEEKRCPK